MGEEKVYFITIVYFWESLLIKLVDPNKTPPNRNMTEVTRSMIPYI